MWTECFDFGYQYKKHKTKKDEFCKWMEPCVNMMSGLSLNQKVSNTNTACIYALTKVRLLLYFTYKTD